MSSDRHHLVEYLIGFRTLAKWLSEPLLLLSLLAPMAGAVGVGQAVGLPSLIWHDDVLDQLLAGAALLLLAVSLGVIGFLLECRGRQAKAAFEEVAIYASRPALLMVLTLLVGWLSIGRTRPTHGLAVFAGLGAISVVSLSLGVLIHTRSFPGVRDAFDGFAKRFGLFARCARLPWDPHFRVDHRLHALQVVLGTVMFALYYLAQAFELPAIAAVALFLVLINGVAGAVKFWLGRYGTLVIVGTLGVALLWHGAQDSPPPGVTKVSLSRAPATQLLDDQRALDSWYARVSERAKNAPGSVVSREPPLVVVATSGGGIRAAMWSVVVLEGLEQQVKGFHDHLRIITGASGGMVGAAHYVSARDREDHRRATPEEVADAASADSLSAVARALVSFGIDRGHSLETAWVRDSNERLGMYFHELRSGEGAGWRPSLVFTPTIVEDGRRLVISNLDLHGLLANPAFRIEQSLCPEPPCLASVSAVQLFAGAGDAYQQLRLASAARMSATFPWITPALVLPADKPRRVVDAGYYDNYGVDLAVQWIRSHEAWFRQKRVPVLVVQIRDGQEFEKRTKIDQDGPDHVMRALSPLSAPIEAFMATRTATMNYRNDAALEELAGDFSTSELGACALATAVFELSEAAPLNWYLDRKTRDDIRRAMPGPLDDGASSELPAARARNRKMLKELHGWWTECSPTPPKPLEAL